MMSRKQSVIILFILLFLVGCSNAAPTPVVEAQPTVTRFPPTLMYPPTPTQSTATIIPTFTPTSAASVVYYMIVLDASANMSAAFDGNTKWDAARETAQKILEALEPEANYGLVTIGASPVTEGIDPCNEPLVARTPFSARNVVNDQISQLRPVGGGSLYTGVRLAMKQFEGVPANTIRVLMVITGSADTCQRDEWSDLEKQFKVIGEAGLKVHSEFIVLDQAVNPNLRAMTDRMVKQSKELQIQYPANTALLQQASDVLIQNVKAFVENGIATRPTEGPALSSFTLTPIPGVLTDTPGASSFTLTPKPGEITNTPGGGFSYTLTPQSVTPTLTPTITFTPVPVTFTVTLTPTLTRTPTPTLAPSVELLSASFRTTGIGCQVDITVKVSGSAATGSFHVMNSSNEPVGEVFPEVILPVGTYGNNIVTLSGNQPATYKHEVWFEYNGTQSNHLKGLVCPLVPKSTPTP